MTPDSAYISGTGFIALALLVFVLLPQMRRWREAHAQFVDLLLVLGGTFVGVFVALDLTARQSRRSEMRELRTLLAAASADVDRVGREFVSLYLGASDTRAGASRLSREPGEISPRLPTVLRAVLERDLVVRLASPEGLGALQDAEHQLELVHGELLAHTQQSRRMPRLLTEFGYHLGYVADLLAIEESFSSGSVSARAASNARNRALARLQGFREHDIPAAVSSLGLAALDTVRWRELFRTR